MSVLYLYALLDRAPAGELGLGLSGEPVRALAAAGFVAAAGALERAPAPAPLSLAAHDATVRRLAARVAAILPLRFGQTVAGEEQLCASIERAAPRLRRALAEVEGCEQITLRLFAEPGAAPPAEPAEEPAAADGPGTSYLLQRLSRRARAHAAPPELLPLLARVEPLVRGERVERFETGPLRANVYHLVRAGDSAAYLERMRLSLPSLPSLRVAVRGPFPPYAFAGTIAP
jgi:hypothetical protein